MVNRQVPAIQPSIYEFRVPYSVELTYGLSSFFNDNEYLATLFDHFTVSSTEIGINNALAPLQDAFLYFETRYLMRCRYGYCHSKDFSLKTTESMYNHILLRSPTVFTFLLALPISILIVLQVL
jgi:hypothetical protein